MLHSLHIKKVGKGGSVHPHKTLHTLIDANIHFYIIYLSNLKHVYAIKRILVPVGVNMNVWPKVKLDKRVIRDESRRDVMQTPTDDC